MRLEEPYMRLIASKAPQLLTKTPLFPTGVHPNPVAKLSFLEALIERKRKDVLSALLRLVGYPS